MSKKPFKTLEILRSFKWHSLVINFEQFVLIILKHFAISYIGGNDLKRRYIYTQIQALSLLWQY
jgi:hypothetical protein